MKDCNTCRYAEYDCLEYYNSTLKDYFVCGCYADGDPDADDCELYEELGVRECQDS